MWRRFWRRSISSSKVGLTGKAPAGPNLSRQVLELHYATNRDGVISPLVIFVVSTTVSNSSHIANSAKDGERAAHPDARSIRGRLTHWRSGRISFQNSNAA